MKIQSKNNNFRAVVKSDGFVEISSNGTLELFKQDHEDTPDLELFFTDLPILFSIIEAEEEDVFRFGDIRGVDLSQPGWVSRVEIYDVGLVFNQRGDYEIFKIDDFLIVPQEQKKEFLDFLGLLILPGSEDD